MISATLHFSLTEAKSFFESAGLEVTRHEMPFTFPGTANVQTMLSVWTVKNPYTNELELLSDAFLRYVQKHQNRILECDGRMCVYNSFKQKTITQKE